MEEKETIPFQTETAKLLQMMIHSVYTTKENGMRWRWNIRLTESVRWNEAPI